MHILLCALAVAGRHEVGGLLGTQTDAADAFFHFQYLGVLIRVVITARFTREIE